MIELSKTSLTKGRNNLGDKGIGYLSKAKWRIKILKLSNQVMTKDFSEIGDKGCQLLSKTGMRDLTHLYLGIKLFMKS